MQPEGHASSLHPASRPGRHPAAGRPKKAQTAQYGLSVDRVIEPGLVAAKGNHGPPGAAALGSALELEPEHALRLADGILAALRQMGGRPVLR